MAKSAKKTREEQQADEYRRVMGEAALKRQQAAAEHTCPVCFGQDGEHSQMCARRRTEKPS